MACHQGDQTETLALNKEAHVQNSGLKLLCFNPVCCFLTKKVFFHGQKRQIYHNLQTFLYTTTLFQKNDNFVFYEVEVPEFSNFFYLFSLSDKVRILYFLAQFVMPGKNKKKQNRKLFYESMCQFLCHVHTRFSRNFGVKLGNIFYIIFLKILIQIFTKVSR